MSDVISTRLLRACEAAENAGGMRVGLPYIRAQTSDIRRILQELEAARETGGKWREAALRIGESLPVESAPNGYYSMAPEEWLSWAIKTTLERKPAEVNRWQCQVCGAMNTEPCCPCTMERKP